MNHKINLALTFGICCLCLPLSLKAQWLPTANASSNSPKYVKFGSAEDKAEGKYLFTIITTEGDTISPKTKIKIPFTYYVQKLAYKENGKEIVYTPENTKLIYTGEKDKIITGVPVEGFWLFETHQTDSVGFYATIPEKGFKYLAFFKYKDQERYMMLTGTEIAKIVKDYPEALKLARKGKVNKAIELYMKDYYKSKNK